MAQSKLKFILPILVVVAGVAAAVILASSRKAPPRTERPSLGPLVEVLEVRREDVPVIVIGNGQVGAKVAVDLVPQVGGLVVRVSPELVAGGFVRAGEVLVQIESRDYELAVERARAAVARANVVLEQQQAEAEVAIQEWQALNPDSPPPSGLVVREPQVRQAEAELAAAEADLQVARLNLERTRLSVPFDGVVVSENIDTGQFIGPGQSVARIYGTEAVEIRVPLESRELAWFAVPDRSSPEGPKAEVRVEYAGQTHTWQGKITRMEAEVDPDSRMVNVVIEVRNPFAQDGGKPSLLPGSFVDVRIFGRTVEGLVPIPRFAVHNGNEVWVANDGSLEIRQVEVVRSDRERAFVRGGLSDGDAVVISSLDAVTDGMTVRAVGSEDDAGGTSPVAALDTGYRTPDSRRTAAWPNPSGPRLLAVPCLLLPDCDGVA